MIVVGPRELQHTDGGQPVLKPPRHLPLKRIGQRAALASSGLLVQRLLQRPGHGRTTMPQRQSDLPLTLATLGQKVDRAAFPLP
jgi:hypothetical protein